MSLTRHQKYAAIFLGFILLFWIFLQSLGTKEGVVNYLFSFSIGIIPFVGGIAAMFFSRKWGGLKSAIGKAVLFIGLGVALWGMGGNIWAYYNFFLNVAAPYPSWADLGYAPSIFFYGLGAVFLAKATGAKYGLKSKYAWIFILISILVSVILSYFLLVEVARDGALFSESAIGLETIFDIAYPLGDFLALTVAIVVSGLSFKYLGGKYKYDIYAILSGLGVMFVADIVFSYTTTNDTFYNGNFGDLLLAIGMFLLTFGVLGFSGLKNT